MSPRSEEFMAVARERAALAATALGAGSPGGAVSAAYYAMLYAARAALSEEDRSTPIDHHADQPPSTTRFAPVTYDEASEARKTTAPSASPASSMRPIGTRAV